MKHPILVTTLVLMIAVATSAAHTDTPIQLKDGALRGLPKEFLPAAFDLDSKILTVAGKKLQLPDSLIALFPDGRGVDQFGEPNPVEGIPYELEFSASWYHGPSLLPPYLLIKITPKDRDFRSEILVDIESVAFLEAHVFLSVSKKRTEVVPVLIEEPKLPKEDVDDWLSIIGKWHAHDLIVEITKDEIQATQFGKLVDYPKGKIAPIEPGVMSLSLPSGGKEIFVYQRKGDILELSFQRAAGVNLAKLGSAADKASQRRNESAEQDAAMKNQRKSE